MAYCPIEQYGVIGNMRSAALISAAGSIDWLCLPHFDSPSAFGAILDDRIGGRFRVGTRHESVSVKQFYWPDTNILVTRFHTAGGVAEMLDFMPVGRKPGSRRPHLIRYCRGVYGEVELEMECRPAFDYARAGHALHLAAGGGVFDSPALKLALSSSVPLAADGPAAGAKFRLGPGDAAAFALTTIEPGDTTIPPVPAGRADELFHETLLYWRRWVGKCRYTGRWREMVRRSALLLKLLTFEPTGAIVAAPTCSLPSPIGGERNWDYRYTWVRDAAFTVYALMRVGFPDEAKAFIRWLSDRAHEMGEGGMVQPLYGIDGRHRVDEIVLPHLEGYRGSRPVRIGNAAYTQLQMDVAGEFLDSVYLYNKYAEPVSYDLWLQLTQMVEWVIGNWQRKDRGVWEVRGPERHFVYSKLMCWVALDRALRLADKRSFPADTARWQACRDDIYNEIMRQGWSRTRRAFVQHFDGENLDASNLMMPLVFFVAPQDPRMLSTIDAILTPASHGGLTADTQIFRYRVSETDDGLTGEEGGFNICTFWLVEALTRAGRTDPARLEQARLLFAKMLACANHVGLYAEQTGIHGQALGNFPQAFTHLSFISAAFNLDRALGNK
ncbi:MAG: glycoside hydrolase family 15 protein [Phycisphaerales bacterium]|nr:glycoside hydrolase family 15 protein [Phycisphaerales bacterium]